jgi:hypothetical protein
LRNLLEQDQGGKIVARSRNIKPGFFCNEDMVELDFGTRLLFAGLWTVADREGRLEDRPKKIKINVFPADDVDVESMLTQLAAKNFIIRYESNGAKYVQVTSWHKHQNPHHTEKHSVIPDINGEITVKQPSKPSYPPKSNGGNLADSLIPDSLNTDSLIPEKKPKAKATGVATPDGVSDSVWDDFKKLRAAKKSPLTQTAIDGIAREATKAGLPLATVLEMCCERGWVGFKAEWAQEKAMGKSAETAYQKSMRLRVAEAAPSLAQPDPSSRVTAIDFFNSQAIEVTVKEIAA